MFLFKREFVDVFHLRLAIGMAFDECYVNVLDQNDAGMRMACAAVRSRAVPSLILFERMHREPRSVQALESIRSVAELRPLPIVILGDGADSDAVLRAYQDGADAFVPLPERASELPRIGRDVAQFWWDRHLQKSA
jgi:DNA-binding NarL/FixJ family response regulator